MTRFRASKSSENETRRFQPGAQSVSPVRIAFISTNATASASELVMAAFVPFLGANAALVGSNSFGKPVGQIALDQTACDDRIRVVAFAKENAAGQGDYYSDPQEESLRVALDFVAGRSCTPAPAGLSAQDDRVVIEPQVLPLPQDPSVAQREMPGAF
jgi:hypothetical protein